MPFKFNQFRCLRNSLARCLGALALLQLVISAEPAGAQPGRARSGVVFNQEFRDGLLGGWSFSADREVGFEDLLDQLIFLEVPNAGRARARLEQSLSVEINEIDRRCRLTALQKGKLLLMGRGDIKRFFDQYYSFLESPSVNKEAEAFVARNDAKMPIGRSIIAIASLTATLRIKLQGNLFREGSLLQRSMIHTLDRVQRERYEALVHERLESGLDISIQNLIRLVEPMTADQRFQMTLFLRSKIEPSRSNGPYGLYYLLIQLSHLPKEEVWPSFSQAQLRILDSYQNRAVAFEQTLRLAGYFPIDKDY